MKVSFLWIFMKLETGDLLANPFYNWILWFFWEWSVCAFRSRMCYYGVFDGHAGPRAAQFAADHLHKNIILKFPKGWW